MDVLCTTISRLLQDGKTDDEIKMKLGEDGCFDKIESLTEEKIEELLTRAEIDGEEREHISKIIRDIKTNRFLEKSESDSENDNNFKTREQIRHLFGEVIEPERIEINNSTVTLTYDFKSGSKLNNRIKDIEKWGEDNVVETISKKLGVPSEKVKLIDSLQSYVEFINTLDGNKYVSRGQKDCTYELSPSLHRIYDGNYAAHSSEYENVFKSKILYYDDSTAEKDKEEIRAYGQHYGLPTNYLDFTEAHLISLLFAVEEYEYVENHSIVYFVDSRSYNKKAIKREHKLIDFSNKTLKDSIEESYKDTSYFIKIANCNERIHFQKGCFLKVMGNDSLKDMYENYTAIAIIHRDKKEKILKELFELGITFESIYPDKDNLVKSIRFIKEKIQEQEV